MDEILDTLFPLAGYVSVVVGGGGHLCSAMAKGLAAAGSNVTVADLRLQKAEAVADEINSQGVGSAIAVAADAKNVDDIKQVLGATLEEFSKVDVLINGAGINASTPFFEIEAEDFVDVVNSHLVSTLIGCQIFGKHMLDQGSGSIINISSASAGPPLSKAFAYSAAKAGVKNLTANLGREWGKQGVRVNAIRPGFFPTEWNKKNFITAEREAAILNHTPMARFGDPEELVGAVNFLASSTASFVTGSELTVDGGFSCMTI